MSREEGDAELSVKSTPHLLPRTITPFPFSIFPSQIEIWSLSRYCLFVLLQSSNSLYWQPLVSLFFSFFFWVIFFCFVIFSCWVVGLVVLTTFTWAQTVHWAGPVLFLTRLPNFGVPTYWLTPRDGKKIFQPVWYAMSCLVAMLGLHNCTQL